MPPTVPMTPAGFERLRARLKKLKENDRPAIIREIATAREHGDLSENAEYHAAREQQGHIEREIGDLEKWLSNAEVIDPTKLSSDKVAFGATVRVSNGETGDEVVYTIVGPVEANSDQGTISIESPLARALIGREVGDEVTVRTPGGVRTFEVLHFEFK
jgi:transcription elongation factor GreA